MSGTVTAGALMVLVACGVVVVSMSGILSATGAGVGSNGDCGGNGVSFGPRIFVLGVGTVCARYMLRSLTSLRVIFAFATHIARF